MIKFVLPDITLLAATSVDIAGTVRALTLSAQDIEFGSIKLLSSIVPSELPTGVEFVQIPHMNKVGYSKFVIKDLYRHFDTSYCLLVQADGFVINPDCWQDDFLQYDYIGAPWPKGVWVNPGNWFFPLDKNRVGNGGFSLRSRKFMELIAAIDIDVFNFPIKSEDIVICHYLYEELTRKGICFAPPELAANFSMESPGNLYGQSINSVFGFHGKHLVNDALRRIRMNSQSENQELSDILDAQDGSKIGRNEPCPCGSGRRYKRCHGKIN